MNRWSSPSSDDYYDPLNRRMRRLPPLPNWTEEQLKEVEKLAEALRKARQEGMGDYEKEKP